MLKVVGSFVPQTEQETLAAVCADGEPAPGEPRSLGPAG